MQRIFDDERHRPGGFGRAPSGLANFAPECVDDARKCPTLAGAHLLLSGKIRLKRRPRAELRQALTFMANRGFKGAEAGRAFRTGMLRLVDATPKARESLAAYGIEIERYIQAGEGFNAGNLMNFLEASGKIDPSKLAGLRQQLEGIMNSDMGDFDKLKALQDTLVSGMKLKPQDAAVVREDLANFFNASVSSLDFKGLMQAMAEKNVGAGVWSQLFSKMQVAKYLSFAEEGAMDELAAMEAAQYQGQGTAAGMMATQMEGAGGAITRMKFAMEGAAIAIANSGFLDMLAKIAESLAGLFTSVSNTSPKLLGLGTAFAALAAAIGPVIWGAGKLVGAFALVAKGLRLLSLAFAANPLGLLVIGVVAAITAFSMLNDETKHTRSVFQEHSQYIDKVREAYFGAARGARNLADATREASQVALDTQLIEERGRQRKQSKELKDRISGLKGVFGWDDTIKYIGGGQGNLRSYLSETDQWKELDRLRSGFLSGQISAEGFARGLKDVQSGLGDWRENTADQERALAAWTEIFGNYRTAGTEDDQSSLMAAAVAAGAQAEVIQALETELGTLSSKEATQPPKQASQVSSPQTADSPPVASPSHVSESTGNAAQGQQVLADLNASMTSTDASLAQSASSLEALSTSISAQGLDQRVAGAQAQIDALTTSAGPSLPSQPLPPSDTVVEVQGGDVRVNFQLVAHVNGILDVPGVVAKVKQEVMNQVDAQLANALNSAIADQPGV